MEPERNVYGDRISDLYDGMYPALAGNDPTVEFLA